MLVTLGLVSAADVHAAKSDLPLPPLASLTSYQAVPVSGKPVSVNPGFGKLLAEGAWVFGVQALYGERAVPYIAPYSMTLSSPGKKGFALAMPEFKGDTWELWRDKAASGQKIEVGLTPNAADRNGVFWFAVLLPEALRDSAANGEGWKIELEYPAVPKGGNPIDYHEELKATDGTALATNIYLPFAEKNPLLPDPPYPVALMRTPYSKEWIDPAYIAWTARFNAVVVTQYFRGRPDLGGAWPCSEGEPCLFSDHAGPEHHDAIDTVNWLAARHWCNGKIMPTGPSGIGMWIYQAAPQLGDKLAGIYPIVAAGDVGAWAAHENGCYKQGNVETWLSSYKFPPKMLEQARERATDQSYWSQLDFNLDADGVNCPGLHETTWWDVSIEQGIKTWKAFNTQGGKKARGRQWIIIGPWPHHAPRTDSVGELSFPTDGGATTGTAVEANMILDGLFQSGRKALDEAINGRPEGELSLGQDPSILPLRWDSLFWVANVMGRNPLYRAPQYNVLAYFIGEEGSTSAPNNSWYELLDWPPPFKSHPLYLQPAQTAGQAGTALGELGGNKPAGLSSQAFVSDPFNPLPTRGGPNIPLGEMLNGPYDQRPALAAAAAGSEDYAQPQVTVWQSAPLERRSSIAGPVKVKLYISTDSADTDIAVKLVDIYPDDFKLPANWPQLKDEKAAGRHLLVCDSAIRLSWWCQRQGLGKVQPGRVYEVELTVGERAYVFEQGHRIGLHIQGSNYPRFAVNPGTGARFMEDKRGVVQTCTLHISPEQPSQLILPLYDPQV